MCAKLEPKLLIPRVPRWYPCVKSSRLHIRTKHLFCRCIYFDWYLLRTILIPYVFTSALDGAVMALGGAVLVLDGALLVLNGAVLVHIGVLLALSGAILVHDGALLALGGAVLVFRIQGVFYNDVTSLMAF